MRFDSSRNPDRFRIDDLIVDIGPRRVFRGSQEIQLPKLSFDMLIALVAAAPNTLSIDELTDQVWHGIVVSPATVAKRVELLRQALNEDSRDPRYVALVRGHGYRLIPTPVPEQKGAEKSRFRHLFAIAAATAMIAGIGWYLMSDAEVPPEKSLAVLPFVSLSSAPEDEIFADGLTEELSHALAGLSDLKVTGRTSSFFFKGKNEDLRVIGETLGVAHLLEGTVRRSGERLRVTAQLVRTSDGFHLWSETYDRTMADVLEVQEGIARVVAERLRSTLLKDEVPALPKEVTVHPRAYALYLRAIAPPGRGIETLRNAQEILEEVVRIDSKFAAAWARLALVNGRRIMALDEDYPYSRQEGWQRVVAANNQALALDPDNAKVHANLAGIAWLMEGDAAKAAPLLERALRLDPGDLELTEFAADFASYIGRIDLAINFQEFLVDRDPLCGRCRSKLAKSYMFVGRLDEAEREFRTYQIMHKGGSEWNLGIILLLKGDPQAALESFHTLDHHIYLRTQGRVLALHDLDRLAEFENEFVQLREHWGDEHPDVISQIYAYLGDKDAAFDWLRKSVALDPVDLQTDFPERLFDNIRSDPRWYQVLREVGRSPQQLAEIKFNPELRGS